MNTRKMVLTAVLIAIMMVLQLTGIGLINLGIVNVTLYCTIIAIGTLLLGFGSGLTLGAVFGIISTIRAIQSPSGLVTPIMAASPLFVVAMCLLPRLLVPIVIWLVNRIGRDSWKSNAIASACGSITNTFLYLGLLLLGYALFVTDKSGVLATVGTVALTAGIPEAIVAAIVAPAIVKAVRKNIKKALLI